MNLIIIFILLGTEAWGQQADATHSVENDAENVETALDPQAEPVDAPPADRAATPATPAREIIVTANRREESRAGAVVTAQVIDRVQIERSGAVVLEQLLEMIPGVQIENSVRGTSVFLRGHDPSHVLLMIDGRRVIGRVDGALDLSRFAVGDIERIEIVRGPTSAVYGADAIAGVIHILTRGAPSEGWQLDAQGIAGGYASEAAAPAFHKMPSVSGIGAGLGQASGRFSLSGRKGLVDGRVGLLVDAMDGWDRDRSTPSSEGDAIRLISPSARLGFALGKHQLDWDLEGSLQDGQGIDGTATGAVIDRLHRTGTFASGLTAQIAPPWQGHVLVQADASLYDDQVKQDQRAGTALDSFDTTFESLAHGLVQLDGWVDTAQRHHLQGGVEAYFEHIETDRIEDQRAHRERGAFYVQHLWRATDKPAFFVQTAMRLDVDSRFGVFPAPRLALRFDPIDIVQIRIATGLGFRAPDFKQLYLDFSNPSVGYRVLGAPSLKPERSVGTTLDLDIEPEKRVHLTLSGWYDELYDLITADLQSEGTSGAPTIYSYTNVGRARLAGTTPTLVLGPFGPVQAQLSYTYTYAWDLDEGRALQGRAPHQGTAQLSGDHDKIGLSWAVNVNLLAPRPYYDAGPDPITTPFTPLLDARVSWHDPKQHIELFAGVDNALDAGRSTLDPTRPRHIYGGISLHAHSKHQEVR